MLIYPVAASSSTVLKPGSEKKDWPSIIGPSQGIRLIKVLYEELYTL
jgi:hypothetical protein